MSTINIRESLRQLDDDSFCKYDLLTMYDSCPLLDEDKQEIAKLLYNKEDPEVIYQKLCTYFCDDDTSEIDAFNDFVQPGTFEIIVNECVNKLKESCSDAQYNDVANQLEVIKDGELYTTGLAPIEIETGDIEIFVDGNYDSPLAFDSTEDAVNYITDVVLNKLTSTSVDSSDDDVMVYTVYDIVEDDDNRLTAKCMNESTNDFQDIKLGKVNSLKVNELLNNMLNNPNYKITDEVKKKIYDKSAPWGLAVQMTSAVDVDGTNGLLSTGDFGGEASFGESIETNFEKDDRVTDGDRQGTVLDYDNQKVLVEWDYSQTDDIEWVDKSDLSFVECLKESQIPMDTVKKDIQSYLNYHLGSNEDYIKVNDVQNIDKDTVAVEYEVHLSIPIGNDEYERDTEYRSLPFRYKDGKWQPVVTESKYDIKTKTTARKLVDKAKADGKKLSMKDAEEIVDQSYNDKADNIDDFYKSLDLDESTKVIVTGKEARKYLWNKIENSKDIKGYWKIEDDFINGGDITVIKDVSDVPNGYKYRFSFLDEVGKTPVEIDAYSNGQDWYIVDYLSDVKLKESVSGRYVWFSYNDIRNTKPKPQQVIDAYNNKYPDYDNPLTGISSIELAGRSYPEKEFHYIVTDIDGNQFWAIVGNVSKDMLDTVQESLEENDEDGWGDRVEQILEPTIEKVEDLAYEVRNTVRGANTGCDTTDELADYVDEVIEDFEDANSSLRHEAKEIDESHEDDIEPNLPIFNELRKQYKNYTTFKDKQKNSGLIRDLCDQLENKKVSYNIYNHKKDNGMTIFYDDCELVESTKVDSEELEAIVNGLDENGYNLNVLSSIKEGLWALFGYQGKDAFDVVEELVTKGYIDSNVLIDAGYTPTSLINESLSPYKKEEFKKQLQDELYDKFIDLARTPEWGFENLAEIGDYLIPTIEVNDYEGEYDNDIEVEFRAEVNYREMEDVCNTLDKVVNKYDKNAYFEPVQPGIAVAYLKFPKKLKEDFEDDEIVTGEQEFDSAATSINSNKLPAVYSMVDFIPGQVVIDFGGGRFDNAVNYLKDKDVTLLVYDPYNRSAEHNKEVLRVIRENGGADAAINSNVLNVIKEPEARQQVLKNIKKLVKPGAPIYITVYEGSGKGNEGPTKAGYQLNRKTSGYIDEISQIFPNVKRRGKLITAINESIGPKADKLRELIDDGVISKDLVVDEFINYLSEDDIADFLNQYDLEESRITDLDTRRFSMKDVQALIDDYGTKYFEAIPTSGGRELWFSVFDVGSYHISIVDGRIMMISLDDPNEEVRSFRTLKQFEDYLERQIVICSREAELKESSKNELTEASYGGALDIEDDQYFTKEEIVEVAEKVCEHLDETYPDKFDVSDVYMETPKTIHVEVTSKEGNWASANAKIDMRKIRKPSDIMKYDVVIGDLVYNLRQELEDLYKV